MDCAQGLTFYEINRLLLYKARLPMLKAHFMKHFVVFCVANIRNFFLHYLEVVALAKIRSVQRQHLRVLLSPHRSYFGGIQVATSDETPLDWCRQRNPFLGFAG